MSKVPHTEEEPFGIIELTQGKFAIVDNDMVSTLKRYHWRAVKHKSSFYAKTTIRRANSQYDLGMHRFVAQTPRGQVPHHKNFNSLDNRRANLQNMSKSSHTLYHASNRILIKRRDELPAT